MARGAAKACRAATLDSIMLPYFDATDLADVSKYPTGNNWIARTHIVRATAPSRWSVDTMATIETFRLGGCFKRERSKSSERGLSLARDWLAWSLWWSYFCGAPSQ